MVSEVYNLLPFLGTIPEREISLLFGKDFCQDNTFMLVSIRVLACKLECTCSEISHSHVNRLV